MLLKRGMGNREWGMGNGERGMGNGEWGMGNSWSLPYRKETRTGCGKRKTEGKNIYLSVFPEFLELLSFCLSKLTKTVDLQVM